ncbi:hypothetical protein BDK51DRAFT_12054, partial [Blyttiomyces helicus]
QLVNAAIVYLTRRRRKCTAVMLFYRWRTRFSEEKRLRLASRVAVHHFRSVQARKALLGWHRAAGATWRRMVEKRMRNEAEKSLAELSREYENRLAESNAQLAETTRQLQASESRLAQQREELRMGLMRGVCALNLEAMSVFR